MQESKSPLAMDKERQKIENIFISKAAVAALTAAVDFSQRPITFSIFVCCIKCSLSRHLEGKMAI